MKPSIIALILIATGIDVLGYLVVHNRGYNQGYKTAICSILGMAEQIECMKKEN